jgi:hypothetical protein
VVPAFFLLAEPSVAGSCQLLSQQCETEWLEFKQKRAAVFPFCIRISRKGQQLCAQLATALSEQAPILSLFSNLASGEGYRPAIFLPAEALAGWHG